MTPADGLEHFCTQSLLICIQTVLQLLRRNCPGFQHMITLLAVSFIAQAHLFDTTRWFGTLIHSRSLLACMPKKIMQPYPALALLFSTELCICKLIKVLVSIRLRRLTVLGKLPHRATIEPGFVLRASFTMTWERLENFLLCLSMGLNFDTL